MKEIKAYIKEHKLDSVVLALHKLGDLPGLSVVDVRGFGSQHIKSGDACPVEDLVKHAKTEIVCKDEQAERIISTIEKSAHTGLRGDGRIFVSSIDQAVSIQTGKI